MPRADQAEFLHWALKGEPWAIRLCQSVGQAGQDLDDLYDGDDTSTPVQETVERLAWTALVEIPDNPFYRAHYERLQPIVRAALIDWFDANALERGGVHQQRLAFVLRDTVGTLVTHCAWLLGGYDWMREVSVKVREHMYEDTFEDYQAGLVAQFRQARQREATL